MTFRPDPKPAYSLQKAIQKNVIQELKKLEAKKRDAFYRMIWVKKPHKCFECGETVKVFSKKVVHHCVEKHLQERYMIDLDNLDNGVILCLLCHSKVHTNDSFAPKTKARTKLLTAEYEKFLK